METHSGLGGAAALSQLRVVGGDPSLELCNSRSGPHDGGVDLDVLLEPADLMAWAEHAGLVPPGGAQGASTEASVEEEAFRSAVALREQLDVVFRAIAGHRTPSAEALDGVRRAAATALERGTLGRAEDSYALAWTLDDQLAVVDRIAAAALSLLTNGPLERVKQCDGCSFLFLDESKNGSRRWCSMEDCGMDAKMRLYVQRRRERRSSPRSKADT